MLSAAKVTHYKLRRFEDVYPLACTITQEIPSGGAYVTGVYELLLNALEHGNLGIGFAAKNTLLRDGRWESEIKRRLMLQRHKPVAITLIHQKNTYKIIIRDKGNGFNWRQYIARANKHVEIHGRGLAIALGAKFDRLFYNDVGNQVTCIIQHRPWKPSPAECQLMRWNTPISTKQWAI